MYPLGLLSLVQALVANDAALKLGIAIPGILLVILLWCRQKGSHEQDDGPPFLPLGIFETLWPFFERRHDFLARGFQLTGETFFRFRLLQVRDASCTFGGCSRLILAI
jgi:hypothetical protein